MRDCRLKQVMSGRIEPIQARLGTQPRQLAFGELPGRRDAAFDCLIQAIFAIQITPELPVSDRANRRQFRMQITERMQRSEEHTSELQSLMRISYAVFCLKKKTPQTHVDDHT